MTSIAVIKQAMRFDNEKVNNICIYELEPIIRRANSRTRCISEANMYRANTRTRNCCRTSNRKDKNTYETAVGAEALDLGSVSSMPSRRLSTSEK